MSRVSCWMKKRVFLSRVSPVTMSPSEPSPCGLRSSRSSSLSAPGHRYPLKDRDWTPRRSALSCRAHRNFTIRNWGRGGRESLHSYQYECYINVDGGTILTPLIDGFTQLTLHIGKHSNIWFLHIDTLIWLVDGEEREEQGSWVSERESIEEWLNERREKQ